MDNKKIVGSIKNLCSTNEMTVGQLEKEIGLSQGLISKWMYTTPSLEKIVDIAKYFHVSLDDVVDYDNGIDDEFLLTLTKRTINKSLAWNICEKEYENLLNIFSETALKMNDFLCLNDFYNYMENRKYVSYFVTFNGGAIIIYGAYIGQNIIKPEDLRLFIQPTNESELIYQNYNTNQLKTLWLKIIYSLNESAPNEIKAEIFKSDFINSNIDSQS